MPLLSARDVLPTGTRLAEFEVQRVLGSGGFGVVYLAFDHTLQRQVAVKEYMPATLAVRQPDLTLALREGADERAFDLGLRSFVNEARLLARFDHPALVKVYRFWESQGTAYMVMPYYQGRTLQAVRREMPGPPDEAWLRALLQPLLGALACLHREQVYHRDIAPDNILLLDSEAGPGRGPPVLLDLGAARRVISDHTQALTAIVKPSFAPIEQYAETSHLRQGPWTDLYALAAVMHFCVTGRPPVPATARTVQDDLPSLAGMAPALASGFGQHYSPGLLQAIDHALAVRPQDRPASVAQWQEELAGLRPVEGGAPGVGASTVMPTVLARPHAEGVEPAASSPDVAACEAFPSTLPARGAVLGSMTGDAPQGTPAADPLGRRFASARRAAWVGLAAVFGVVTMGLGWFGQRPASAPTTIATPIPAASAVQLAVASGPASATPMPAAPLSAVAASAPVSAAQEPKAKPKPQRPGPLNPRTACAGKSFIFLAICMKQHCSRPAYSRHPECVQMRKQEEAQRNQLPP